MECPVGIIVWDSEDSPPRMAQGEEGSCLGCGHCVAVCPQGALDHKMVPLSSCPAVEKQGWDLKAVTFLLRSRRSIRAFQDRPVEREKLQRLIEIARYAPTGGNSQSVQWTVFTDSKVIREIASLTIEWIRDLLKDGPRPGIPPYMPRILRAWDLGRDSVLRGAPALVIASSPKDDPNGVVNLTIALSYLEIVALPMGLGTCWAGILQRALNVWEPLKSLVELPKGHAFHYPMMVGYPKFRYWRLPERRPPVIHWR